MDNLTDNPWYVARDGFRHGPFSASSLKEQARSGQLMPMDHIWREGMNKWVEARNFRWLFDNESARDPPVPPKSIDILPRYSVCDGVVFCENDLPHFDRIRDTVIAIHGFFFTQAQLKSLDDVKRKLALEVNAAGGNCLAGFQYGQRSTWWTTLLGIDDVSWYGNGVIGRIPAHLHQQMVLDAQSQTR